MDSLSQHGPEPPCTAGEPACPTAKASGVPRLLLELPPWPKVFFDNLGELLRAPFNPGTRTPRALRAPFQRARSGQDALESAGIWQDVFVPRWRPGAAFARSVLYHVVVVAALWGMGQTWWGKALLKPRPPFRHYTVIYYPVSEYLPALEGGAEAPRPKTDRKGEPALARQRIVSAPPHPDNTSQTIVTPSPWSIRQHVSLPNLVAWVVPPPPVAVTALPARLLAPRLPGAIAPPPQTQSAGALLPATPLPVPVPPPPQVQRSSSPKRDSMLAEAVPPPPEVRAAKPRQYPLPPPAVVPPPPAIDEVRHAGSLNLAPQEPVIAVPHLPEPKQQARWVKAGQVHKAASSEPVLEHPPAISGVMPSPSGQTLPGTIVALGLKPVVPQGPVAVPEGNRRGEFAAGPEGRSEAPGTPDFNSAMRPNAQGGAAHPGAGSSAGSSLAGIHVAPGPVNPGPVAAAGPSVGAPVVNPPRPAPALLSALKPMRVSDIARQTRPGAAPPTAPPSVEQTVFGGKRYYQMTLNMPNLSSSGGSWVVRFAELKAGDEPGELMPPVATVKVDPAYPAEAQRERLGGIVVLYAVIHADGTVGQIRVLHSIDSRLDDSARAALGQWRFRPAMKNGATVELEAIIRIPFEPGHTGLQ